MLSPTFLKQDKIEKCILNTVKKQKQIVYGGRSIQKQIGIFSRPTTDFDIFTSNPKSNAYAMEKKLDKIMGFDYFYKKKGMNKSTWKVKNKGKDMKKGTQDDEGVVDYTQTPKPKPKVKKINGVYYRNIKEELKAKRCALKDKEMSFRHKKDLEDIHRIKLGGKK